MSSPRQYAERDAEIARLVALGRETYETLGRLFGVSKQRIHQIAQAAGVDHGRRPTPALPRKGPWPRCPVCGASVPRGTMTAHRFEAGHTRAGTVDAATAAHLEELHRAGWDTVRIGRALGLHPKTVFRWIVRLNLPRHPPGPARLC